MPQFKQGVGIHFTFAGSDKSLPGFTLPQKNIPFHLKVHCSFSFSAVDPSSQAAAAKASQSLWKQTFTQYREIS